MRTHLRQLQDYIIADDGALLVRAQTHALITQWLLFVDAMDEIQSYFQKQRQALPMDASEADPILYKLIFIQRSVSQNLKQLSLHWVIIGSLFLIMIGYYVFNYFYVYTSDAYVEAYNVSVNPEVSGPVSEVFVKEGQLVKKGDLCFKSTQHLSLFT